MGIKRHRPEEIVTDGFWLFQKNKGQIPKILKIENWLPLH